MNNCDDIVLLVTAGRQQLLQYVGTDADLDAGHWRLPACDSSQTVAKPQTAFCGVEQQLAGSVQQCLRDWGLEEKLVQRCRVAGVQSSPAWHPCRMQRQVVHLELSRAEPPTTEPQRYRWQPAQAWLSQWQAGDVLLNPLAQGMLQHGENFDWANSSREATLHGVDILPLRSHTLPPASHTNTLLLGDDEARWLVDPSPANSAERQRLIALLQDQPLAGIFLTHHHGDHHQQSVILAQHFDIPIYCSADTAQRIPQRFGRDYWQDRTPQIIQHGEQLCLWKGQPVRCYAVPGHDAGQLALMPDDRRWILVGDLIQGIGTVVIAKPEGDMTAYFNSLQWVIEQQPAAIIPSHGQVMGSAYRIQQTLEHRKLREQQVLQLQRQGHSPQDMVAQIYADVDKRLWGLARMNIDCHLDKLAAEGRL